MTRWKAFWTAAVVSLFGISLWRNRRLYRDRGWKWYGFKSVVDTLLAVGLALRMPALLAGYVIMWFTKPLEKRPALRLAVSTLLGMVMTLLSGFAMEIVLVAGVFAMDLLSGGIWQYWQKIGQNKIDWKAEIGLRRKQAA